VFLDVCATLLPFLLIEKKLDNRVVPGVFLGFKPNTKGFLFLNLKKHKIDLSINFIFHENCFLITPSMYKNNDSNSLSLPIPGHYAQTYDDLDMQSGNNVHDVLLDNTIETNVEIEQSENVTASPRRSTRNKRMPAYLQDFEVSNISNNTISTKCPINSFLNYNALYDNFKHRIMLISSTEEPQNYEEVIMHPSWVQAMKEELKALEDNKIWFINELPLGKIATGCRWVYKVKHKVDDFIERYEAHLVAKGYTQIEGLDFLDTFAPVAKLTTLRLLLALATTNNWTLKQLDVNNVFLHGELDEEVYMVLPPGLHSSSTNLVSCLRKSLYGLKQEERQLYAKLSNFLISLKYNISIADHSLF